MSDGIKVNFAEIDGMSNAITTLNAYAAPLVPKVGALSADGDLLASAILSPGTAVTAERAVLNASAQLGVTVVSTEALVLITVSISKVYEAAEVALAVAVPLMEHTADQALLLVAGGGTLSLVTTILGVSTATAVAVDGVPAFVKSVWGALGEESSWKSPGAFGVNVMLGFASNFSVSDFSSTTVSTFQGMLGANGDLGYNTLLSLLLHEGRGANLFADGTATSKKSDVGDVLTKRDGLNDIAREIYGRSQYSRDPDDKSYDGPLQVDENGNVQPRDVSELWAGAAQIDGIGAKQYGDLRIIRVEGDGGPRFVVQIPSTQVWDPRAGAVPNDLTSDVLAMRYGDSTALAQAVREQLMDIPEVKNGAPVMLTGFSLGGITAGAIAADPKGLNVQQVVTAGAPIGRMDIAPDIPVTSYEAREDPIARLDGTDNPSRPGWTTVSGAAPAFAGRAGDQSFINAHNASRYSIMAAQDDQLNKNSDVSKFLQGDQTITDYKVTRDE